MGPHDLSISSPPTGGESGAEDLKLKGGLTVMPSLAIESASGGTSGPMVSQGGLVDVAVRNLDYRDNPFWSLSRFAGPISTIGTVTATTVRMSGTAIVDVLAPTGALPVGGSTVGPFGQNIYYVSDAADMAAPQVKARAATALTLGMAKSGETISEKRATNLYKFTTAMDSQVVHMQFGTLGAGWAGGLRPIGYTAPSLNSPVFNYPYARTREVLEALTRASAPEMDALRLYRIPIAPAVSRNLTTPSSSALGMKRR